MTNSSEAALYDNINDVSMGENKKVCGNAGSDDHYRIIDR